MIYLDHHATTPCDPRVVEAMLPYFSHYFGNASSAHELGTQAANAVETAREQVAALLGASSGEIIWTSGATEANNIAIFGLARGPYAQRLAPQRRCIVTTAIEHKAVLEPCRALQEEDFEVVVLPVEPDGRVNLQSTHEAIDENTLLVSIQAANGEIGTIQTVAEIARLAHEAGALVHCDAAQAVGKIPVDVSAWDVDMLSLSGHKIYAPKGVGALYVRRGLAAQLAPLQRGGGQERGLRPGTLPVPLLVALGKACQLCEKTMPDEAIRLASLRDELEARLQAAWPSVRINGAYDNRLPHNSSLTFPDVEADALLATLPDVALSTGSACESGAIEPSKVLLALGLSRQEAHATVRVGLGRNTSARQVEEAGERIAQAIKRLHAKSHRPSSQVDSAFYQTENGSFELGAILGADYRNDDEGDKDEERELDKHPYADEEDLRITSASPEDDIEAEEIEQSLPVAPPLICPFQLRGKAASKQFWRNMFDEIVPVVFAEFGVDEELGCKMVFYAVDPQDMEDGEKENRLYVTQIQASVLAVFHWAFSHNIRDHETLLEEIRGSMIEPATSPVNEFIRHSNGVSAVWRAYFDYEGSSDDGASLNDGYSIQSSSRVTRNFEY